MTKTHVVRFENESKFNFTGTQLRSNLLHYPGGEIDGFAEVLPNIQLSRIERIGINIEPGVDSGGDELVNIIMIVEGIEYWYDTFAEEWLPSDGSYLESTPIKEIGKRALLLLLPTESVFTFKLAFNSQEEVWISSVEVEYYTEEATPATIPKCLVYGYISGEDGKPKADFTVNIELDYDKKELITAGKLLVEDVITLTTDENGYWSTTLIPSNQYDQLDPMLYKLSYGQKRRIRNRKASKPIYFEVPELEEANVSDIIVAVP